MPIPTYPGKTVSELGIFITIQQTDTLCHDGDQSFHKSVHYMTKLRILYTSDYKVRAEKGSAQCLSSSLRVRSRLGHTDEDGPIILLRLGK